MLTVTATFMVTVLRVFVFVDVDAIVSGNMN